MRKINIRFLLGFCCYMLIGFDANAQAVLYMRYDYDNEPTLDVDSAAFKRVVYDKDHTQNAYPIVDYYLDGKLKGRGFASTVNPFTYTGQKVEYFKNGKKRMMGHFKDGQMPGPIYLYHQNGRLYAIQEYPPTKQHDDHKRTVSTPIITALKDSSGVDMIKDGLGHYIEYDEYDPNIITAEGDILNGRWEGEVKGFLPREGLKYTEVYKDGILISGLSTDSLGNEYKYLDSETLPVFEGGMKAFHKNLARNLLNRTPENQELQGKAIVKFRVYADGRTGNFEIANTVNAKLGQEAIDAVKAAGNWLPARVKGKPVNDIVMAPIVFSVN